MATSSFLRPYCYQVSIAALVLLAVLEYNFGVLLYNGYYREYSSRAALIQSITAASNDSTSSTLNILQGGNDRRQHRAEATSLLCPDTSPLLVGRNKVSPLSVPTDDHEPIYGRLLEPGGKYRPRDCWPRYRVAIIVPFRDRDEHLPVFLHHMHPFLQRQQLDYAIFIVEQLGDANPFNRAMLMNVGAAEVMKLQHFQCFVFHDVDLLPEDDRNAYSCTGSPRHMSVAIDVFNYTLPYDTLFGGVSAMTASDFLQVNGFSNLFWGWGGEDDDMSDRIAYNNMSISRSEPSVARYTSLAHEKSLADPSRFYVRRNGDKRSQVEGFNTLKYNILELQLKPMYTHILVKLVGHPHSY